VIPKKPSLWGNLLSADVATWLPKGNPTARFAHPRGDLGQNAARPVFALGAIQTAF
jgi:hypothetical protein